MSKWIVDIHGDIEGDYEIIKKYEEPKTGHWIIIDDCGAKMEEIISCPMTSEEAIKMLKSKMDGNTDTSYEWAETVRMAIQALKQEPILDKIRAEITEEKDFAYADFERYIVEYLGVDAEYAEDELPLDDFRYGMERAIEIIDKYKEESEDKPC